MQTSFLFRVAAIIALLSLPHAAWAHDAENSDGHGVNSEESHSPDYMRNLVVALPNSLKIEHPMILVAGPAAKSVAAYLDIENGSDSDDRLIGASTDIADSAGLHTHIMEDDIAKMRPVEGGFVIPAGGRHDLTRGRDHIMIMGLRQVPRPGEIVYVTLSFEKAGDFPIPFLVMQAGEMHHDHE